MENNKYVLLFVEDDDDKNRIELISKKRREKKCTNRLNKILRSAGCKVKTIKVEKDIASYKYSHHLIGDAFISYVKVKYSVEKIKK